MDSKPTQPSNRIEVVTISVDALRALIRAELDAALTAHVPVVPSILDEPTGLLTIAQTAKRFGVSEATINRFRKEDPPLPVVVVGARPRIDAAAADVWMSARGKRATKAAPLKDDVDISDIIQKNGFVRTAGGR